MFLQEDLSDRYLVLSTGEFPSRLFSDNNLASSDWRDKQTVENVKNRSFDIDFIFPGLQSDNYRGLYIAPVSFFVKFLPTVQDCVAVRIFAVKADGNIVLVKSWKP